jgi:hypothetical protein
VIPTLWVSEFPGCHVPFPFQGCQGRQRDDIPIPHNVAYSGNVRMNACRPIAVEHCPKLYHTIRSSGPIDSQRISGSVCYAFACLYGFSTTRLRLFRGLPMLVKIEKPQENTNDRV